MKKLLFAITVLCLPSVMSSQVLTQHLSKAEVIKRGTSFKNGHLSNNLIEMPPIDTESIRKKNNKVNEKSVLLCKMYNSITCKFLKL